MKTPLSFKKVVPLLILIIAFSGFLSTQILWDTFDLNAEQVSEDKQKYSVYEQAFQGLKLTTTKSTTIELKIQKEPLILLNFWASWCLPCLKEFPSLNQLQSRYSGQLKVIGINGDEVDGLAEIKKIESKYKLNFASVSDPNSEISNQFFVSTYPVSILFHKGKVIFVSKKIHNFMDEKFLKMIDQELKAN
jgi:thiol-disulfide isomerase/thioredoxin